MVLEIRLLRSGKHRTQKKHPQVLFKKRRLQSFKPKRSATSMYVSTTEPKP